MFRQLLNVLQCVPEWLHVVIGDGVTPGGQAQGQDDAGSSGQEEHAHAHQHRQEG